MHTSHEERDAKAIQRPRSEAESTDRSATKRDPQRAADSGTERTDQAALASKTSAEPGASEKPIDIVVTSPDKPISFEAPPEATSAEQRLITDIVILDHLSLSTINPKSQTRAEIWRLLYNAIVIGLVSHEPTQGRRVLEQAQLALNDHVETVNRLRYLLGVVLGTLVLAIAAIVILLLSSSFGLHLGISAQLLIGLFAFAGMGTLASVLSRLSSLDLGRQRGALITIVSGASRPLVSIILAIVVYLILTLGIVSIQIGSGPVAQANAGGVYLIAGFLSGFSERFAQDIIASVPFGRSDKASGGDSSSQVP